MPKFVVIFSVLTTWRTRTRNSILSVDRSLAKVHL